MRKEIKTRKRINGGFAIYYGMGSMLSAIATMIVTLFKIWSGKAEFNWAVLIILLVFAAVSGFVGYLLLRVGYEEIEN